MSNSAYSAVKNPNSSAWLEIAQLEENCGPWLMAHRLIV